MDGEILKTEENTNPLAFENVSVFVSDNFHPSADVRIRGLKCFSCK